MTASARKSLLENVLHSLGTSVALIPLSFLINVLLARLLGPEKKGGYDLFMATGALLMMASGLSLPSGITYVAALSTASLSAMARWLMAVALGQGVLTIFLLGVAGRLGALATFLPQGSGVEIILFCAIYVFLSTSAGYWRSILIGQQKIIPGNRIALLTRLTEAILLFALLGILWLIGRGLDLRMVIGLLLANSLIANVLFLRELRVPLVLSPQGSSGFRQIVEYSAPCYLGNLAQFLNYRLDMFLVSAFVGQKGVGLYALAVSLAQLVWLLSKSVATALLPKVAGQQELMARNARLTAQATRFSLWISLLASATLSLVVILALPLIYGEAFRGSISPLLWLMPGIVAIGPAFVLASYIAGIGKPQINLIVSLVALFFTLVLDLLLIPRIGIVGAAFASTVSYSVSAALTAWFFVRESRIRMRDLVLLTSKDIELAISFLRTALRRVRFQSA